MNMPREVVPVILAGGQGKRLRPLTSEKRPKPFLRFMSKTSLFQDTVLRCAELGAPIIVCHQQYLPYVLEDLSKLSVVPRAIILEPEHKGTAAAIAMAAFSLKNQDKTMLVLPSDHAMEASAQDFAMTVEGASEVCDEYFALLGVKPCYAERSYGYISCKDKPTQNGAELLSFIEKPSAKHSEILAADECVLWNTGIFLARPRLYLGALEGADYGLFKVCQQAYYNHHKDGLYIYPDRSRYKDIENVSADYAVMEHLTAAKVFNLPYYWSDVGTWRRLLSNNFSILCTGHTRA